MKKQETTSGKCQLCKTTFNKAGMTKHLPDCIVKHQENSPKKKPHKGWLLQVSRTPYWWLYVLARTNATLGDLDNFLRDTWLECCGHLSSFEILGKTYESGGDPVFGSDHDESEMSIQLDKVLKPKLKFTHEYDFGTTTELELKVLTEANSSYSEPIKLLARNDPPELLCDVCKKPAKVICTDCILEGQGWLCTKCSSKHECDEEMFLPVVNSPRTGVCGYTG